MYVVHILLHQLLYFHDGVSLSIRYDVVSKAVAY